jgi:hypothetical protein
VSGAIAAELELRDRIAALITTAAPGTDLDALARDLFDYQWRRSAAYRDFGLLAGVDPAAVTGWESVPLLPQLAWKELRVSTVEPGRIHTRFRSSGTSMTGSRSIQELPATDLYDLSLERTFAAALAPDHRPRQLHALLPSVAEAPDSSLSYMVMRAATAVGSEGVVWHVRDGRLDVDAVTSGLAAARDPVIVCGTAFAFVHLLDARGGRPLPLPAESRVMETGGFKGRSREVDRDLLHTELARLFGLERDAVLNQYGMCETSTQFYDRIDPTTGARAKHAPPWARVRVLEPRSGTTQPPGVQGLIAIWDPANLYTCAAILTADLGRSTSDGGFEIDGRAPTADARGCSLAAEDLEVVG